MANPRVPEHELEFKATRAGGPGGQHVNTSSTRIEVRWNVIRSAALSDWQRARLLEQLGGRIDSEGWVRVVAAASRSQLQNREAARARLLTLVANALAVPKDRKATKIPRASREQRLEAKRRQSRQKSERRRPSLDD
ncbi:MAG: aminoacyl-tRNA hydrolase [Gemmatimonadetes bacterium]|nr:aminoacyl-tRNA hydrolase [Gemmatimonadota bacterium]